MMKLRAILNTAVVDELIVRNPCAIKGAGVERTPERPVATIAQVWALADAVEPRFRALVLTAAFAGLTAAAGASTAELMARMGQASYQAALRYQHATQDRDSTLARALDDLVAGSTEHPGTPAHRHAGLS